MASPDAMHLFRCPAMAEVVKAVIPSFDKVLELDLPPHLFAGIPHALPADPRLFYIAPNENISSPTIDCVQVGEAFGTPYKHIPAAIPGNIAFDAYRDRVGVCSRFTGQIFLALFKAKLTFSTLQRALGLRFALGLGLVDQ